MTISSKHIVNAAKARALYLDKLKPEEAAADWHYAVREARKQVIRALRASNYLADMGAALCSSGVHSIVFRQLLAPPMSQDQFKLACPEWPKQSEKKGAAVAPLRAAAAAAALVARLDHGIVRWPVGTYPKSARDVATLLRVASTLLGQQQLSTARRGRLAQEQETAIVDLLKDKGWTKLPSKLIDTRAAVPPKHFMHKTRFATATTAAQEVDIACGLSNTYVLAMECKVTNDETNSVKRVNDVLKKAKAWKDHWGSFVKTAALLQGVIAPKDVQRLTDDGVEVFWSHDLPEFEGWLLAQMK